MDELSGEDHETPLRALLSSRKAGLRTGRGNAHSLAVALRRAGRVTAGSFVGRKNEANDRGIGLKLHPKVLIQKEKIGFLAATSTPSWVIQSKRTADLAAERPNGLKNLFFIARYAIYFSIIRRREF
ncbi:MAG: hypothetical protein A2157_13875 [Deltaproteobacteria bacterium RBG_16_47_11]|nr:MAG: hypothetical protein A2157_13875 [Deltaproteobacteria bacterium RBG_16_47_11]